MDALLLHTSVPEAAEYLIGIDSTQSIRNTFNTFPRTDVQSNIQLNPTNTNNINEDSHLLTAIQEETSAVPNESMGNSNISATKEKVLIKI